MSLVAHYNLNGNFNNTGVGDAEMTVSTTPTYVNGKAGLALSNGGGTGQLTKLINY
jgi:hypothetical protein